MNWMQIGQSMANGLAWGFGFTAAAAITAVFIVLWFWLGYMEEKFPDK